MNILRVPNVTSPWWPLLVAKALADGKPADVYPLPFDWWILWHYACLLKGEGFQPAPEGVTLDQLKEAA